MKAIPLSQRNSAYVSRDADWTSFLSCWGAVSSRLGAVTDVSAPGPSAGDSSVRASDDEIRTGISSLEAELKTELPQSYKDFLFSYRPAHSSSRRLPWGESSLKFLANAEVGNLAKLRPELIRVYEESPIDAPDKSYFVYGIKQDDVALRTKYLRNAILVATYGDALHEIVLLYPDLRTIDGEMEAAILFHTGQFRAPSFAELMRQLSFLGTGKSDHVPPYPQAVLKGTCAEKILLSNVWWD